MNIDKYSNLNEFREANPLVNTTFCWAVSNTMTNYDLNLARACRLLESAGILIWANNVPIINLTRSDFWMPKQKENNNTQLEAVEAPQEEDKAQSRYISDKEIRCVYFTLVVRNKALEKKYDGGLKGFVIKHLSEYNDDVVKICGMAPSDLDDAANDIEKSGLIYGEDYLIFDASRYFPAFDEGKDAELDVTWLKGLYEDGGMAISFVSKE